MGLGIVLIFWLFVGTLAAGLGAALLRGIVASLTRGVTHGRHAVRTAAFVFPFACLAWTAVVFVLQAFVNEKFLGRDLGLGDTWHCPLPMGYQVMMIDVTDVGLVFNPKTQRFGGVGSQEDAVFNVRSLQVAGPLILGGVDSQAMKHFGDRRTDVDSYFVLDTRVGRTRTLPSLEDLRGLAQQQGVQLKLEPIRNVYLKFRSSWFDVVVGISLCAPPVAGLSLLALWVLILRRLQN